MRSCAVSHPPPGGRRRSSDNFDPNDLHGILPRSFLSLARCALTSEVFLPRHEAGRACASTGRAGRRSGRCSRLGFEAEAAEEPPDRRTSVADRPARGSERSQQRTAVR